MANAVAIVSVVATSMVAILVPFINARLERRRLDHAGLQAREEDLRRLLDEAGVHLGAALAVLFDLAPSTVRGPDDKEQARRALPDKVDESVRDGIRLALRVRSEHPVSVSHKRAREVIFKSEYGVRPKREVTDGDVGEFTDAIKEFQEECRCLFGLP
jgi:hypothetical protein